MNIKANVSLSEVNAINDVVKQLNGLGGRFESGTNCVEELRQYIVQLHGEVNELYDSLSDAESVLSDKIEKTKHELDECQSKLERLNEELSDIENQLANTDETIEITISEDNTVSMPNPEYARLQAKAAAVEREIAGVERTIHSLQNKLHRMNELHSRLHSYQKECEKDLSVLNDSESNCQKTKEQLTKLNTKNAANSEEATEKLTAISRIIEEYQSLKIKYDSSPAYDPLEKLALEALVNFGSMFISRAQNAATGGTVRKDDKGKPYREGDSLKKNNTFERNGYKYTTDNHGRVISASGTLNINEEGQANRKMSDSLEIIGKGFQKATDDRGHLIGHQFNGSDSLENLVPQNAGINRGIFKKLEDYLAGLVKQGYSVTANVIPVYSQHSYRPDAIFYFYTVNDCSFTVLFPNESKEG